LRVLDPADQTTGGVAVLADHTTIRLGGPAAQFVRADEESVLVDVVSRADADELPVLVLGGGSNLVVSDGGFDGLVLRVGHRGIRFERSGDTTVVTAAAGEVWDDVVAATLREGLSGLECMSGIPGLVGATPIQNVGAYGAEIADVVVSVRAFDRRQRREAVLTGEDCGFGYRTSALKGKDRYLVLDTSIALRVDTSGAPIRYAQLAEALDTALGTTAPAAAVRAAVLRLRAAKGMLIDPADPDSVSAGSFFTNPMVRADALPSGAPAWPVGAAADGLVKTSAAWLIEHAGFDRGFGSGRVGVSTKHTLALVNRGGATTAELLDLARTIRDRVRHSFGIVLEVEPALVGVQL
jgi:UDP-N-acetylmuramate dehydrogenase